MSSSRFKAREIEADTFVHSPAPARAGRGPQPSRRAPLRGTLVGVSLALLVLLGTLTWMLLAP